MRPANPPPEQRPAQGGPERWPLAATVAAASRHAGARRVVVIWLALAAAAVGLGVWPTPFDGGLPVRAGPFRFAVSPEPSLLIAVPLGLLLGPAWGGIPAALAAAGSALASGLSGGEVVAATVLGPVPVLVVWGGMTMAGADPALHRGRDLAAFAVYAMVGSVAGSLHVHVTAAARELGFGEAQSLWEGWLAGTVLELLVVGAPLVAWLARTVRPHLHRALPAPPATGLGTAGGLAVLLATLGALLATATVVLSRFLAALGAEGAAPRAVQRELWLFLAVFLLASLAATAFLSAGIARHGREQERLTQTDPLTGCLNRRALAGVARRELHRAQRVGTPLAVLMVDLDGFKDVNDRHGHAAGDAVLAEVAARLRGALRDTDELFRWGGDEFLVLAPHTTGGAARRLALRLRRSVDARPVPLPGGPPVSLTASVGVATGNGPELDIERLIAAADAALYRAKEELRGADSGTLEG